MKFTQLFENVDTNCWFFPVNLQNLNETAILLFLKKICLGTRLPIDKQISSVQLILEEPNKTNDGHYKVAF